MLLPVYSIPNFLTLDVEEWFDAEIPRMKLVSSPDPKTAIEEQIGVYIDICGRLNVKSTCFILGELAENKPHIVKKLYENGHEIASHSYSHRLVYTMSQEEFRRDLNKSVRILEDLTGEKVKGFRAPSWSVNAKIAAWFYRILEEEELLYSSSLYPGKTFLYGMPDANPEIHIPVGSSIVEIPQQLLNISGFRTGFAGGTFFRLLPAWFIKLGIKHKNKKGFPVFIYLHPWELIYRKYPIKLSLTESIIQYFGIKKNMEKVVSVSKSITCSFTRMDKFIELYKLD